jgi:hypothetical protein
MAPDSFQLVQRSGPTPGKNYGLSKNEVYMGRDITNDIVINDPEISRKHARLTIQSGGYLLEDLGSTNGTFIDGQRITGPHMMSPGEVIMLGDNVSLVFEAAADPDATVAVSPDELAIPASPPPLPSMPARSTGPLGSPTLETPAEETSNARVWVLAGCGCIVLFLCLIAGGLLLFDALDLYCTPPFDAFLCNF